MAGGEAVVKPATFYGLGVGPGDPELITLKAWRVLSLAPVIAYPKPDGSPGLARRIVAPFIPEDATELPIPLPMATEREPGRAAYDAGAELVSAHLDAGRDVAFLCEGDPFFYGSFMYLHERLAPRHRTVVVPGVSSLTASAAVLGRPLAARNEVLKVLPAPVDTERLEAEIAAADSVAIIKVGRHFEKVRALLRRMGLSDRAMIVEAATRDDQRITPLEQVPDGERPYFSTILVYKGAEKW